MNFRPYAAPKSELRDVLPETPRYWLRIKWFYLFVFAVWSSVIIHGSHIFTPFSLVSMVAGMTLGILLSICPVQGYMARRAFSPPWCWDVLALVLIAITVLGALFEDSRLSTIGFASILEVVGAILLGSWVVEARHPVLVYCRTREFVFVEKSNAT